MSRSNITKMMWARRFVLQGLYEWQLAMPSVSDIEKGFLENPDFIRCNSEYFSEVLRGILRDKTEIETIIAPILDRPIDHLDPVERAILWLGTYELKNHLEIPYKVIINESVELSKKFGADQSHKYINGILDKVAKQIRLDYHTKN